VKRNKQSKLEYTFTCSQDMFAWLRSYFLFFLFFFDSKEFTSHKVVGHANIFLYSPGKLLGTKEWNLSNANLKEMSEIYTLLLTATILKKDNLLAL
jgi:hypothetical protein